MKFFLCTIVLSLVFINAIYGQACCTAGTPLLGSLEMTSAQKGVLQIGVTGEYNFLNDVFEKTQFLENEERERNSKSLLFEINYGISKSFSLSALFSYIQQTRIITTLNSIKNKVSANGIGDAILLVKYNLINLDIFARTQLSFGIGLKFPFGKSSIKNNSILLPADMQPGSGSFDEIFWGNFSTGDLLLPEITYLLNSSYRLNGSNKRFEDSDDRYKFGNELIISSGFAYSLNSILDLTILARYRHTTQDLFSSSRIPNTGGSWVYLIPGVNLNITDNVGLRFSGQLPIYRNVLGTQLTTTYTAAVSLFYSIKTIERSF